ncbi:MAG TPA: class I SAM-dependent methyltransferase [Longimicrobiales bacterium]|nr:class I SAM-dependent methyltransferase [Longimicrobiales bacterium]
MASSLADQFGRIDIYLFDLLIRGVIRPGHRILDAGCGGGRNLHYLLREGFDVYAVDRDPEAVAAARAMAVRLAPDLVAEVDSRMVRAPVDALPFPDARFDVVLSSAVLHFADSPEHFRAMVDEMWRVLAPGGLLWARLASNIGIEDRVRPLGKGSYTLPDGTDRFLVDEALLLSLTEELGGTMVDPIKTTNVQGMRCMSTWVLRRP